MVSNLTLQRNLTNTCHLAFWLRQKSANCEHFPNCVMFFVELQHCNMIFHCINSREQTTKNQYSSHPPETEGLGEKMAQGEGSQQLYSKISQDRQKPCTWLPTTVQLHIALYLQVSTYRVIHVNLRYLWARTKSDSMLFTELERKIGWPKLSTVDADFENSSEAVRR